MKMSDAMGLVLWSAYGIGNFATFIKLTFFDGYQYNWWNWIFAIVLNEFLSAIWPIYWLILRPIFGNG